jgi:hypothetical protein
MKDRTRLLLLNMIKTAYFLNIQQGIYAFYFLLVWWYFYSSPWPPPEGENDYPPLEGARGRNNWKIRQIGVDRQGNT